MKAKLLFLLLVATCLNVRAQRADRSLEIQVISETLPAYLNTNPNSPASFTKGHRGYSMLRSLVGGEFNMLTMPDSVEQSEMRKELAQLDYFADSLQQAIFKEKIQVRMVDSLFAYDYKPDEYTDLRTLSDWKEKYQELKADFTENKWVRLDTTISMDFADLIKKQIDLTQTTVLLDLTALNNDIYHFIDTATLCINDQLCFEGHQLFWPVFNKRRNKACYLFSYRCRSGICRDFIFAEKRKGKWHFLDAYPSHLIGNESHKE